jgi:hypothetical protein
MTEQMFGGTVDALIPLLAGVYATLLGFRVVGKRPGVDPKYDAKMNRSAGMMQLLGPVLVLFGAYRFLSTFS